MSINQEINYKLRPPKGKEKDMPLPKDGFYGFSSECGNDHSRFWHEDSHLNTLGIAKKNIKPAFNSPAFTLIS